MNEGVNELMNERMKDMKRIIMILMAVALVALPTMAQSFSSKRTVDNDQRAAQSFTTTEPFRSTSAMQTSGSVYSANPVLNENGTAYNPSEAAMSAHIQSGPRKSLGDNPSDPGKTTDESSPIGDAVLPLMLMAVAFCGYIALRRRKALKR